MKIHSNLPHVNDYTEQQSRIKLEDVEPEFYSIMKRIKKFKEINGEPPEMERIL